MIGIRTVCWVLALLWIPTVAADEPKPDTPPAPVAEDWEKRSDQRFETIAAGGNIHVINPYGNIYSRFGGYERNAEILTTTQRIDREYPELLVRYEHGEKGLTIRVVPAEPVPADVAPSAWRDRVDIVVFVPLDVPLIASTDDGAIELKGVRSDVTLESVKGDIRTRKVKGRIVAETQRGDVAITMENDALDRTQRVTTVTGDIEVYLWEDADVTVDVATSGEIATDFSMQIEHRRFEEPGKYGKAIIDSGQGNLVLRSKRGRVKIGRLPRDFKRETNPG